MPKQTPIEPPADNAPYSLETFQWLMENSSAKNLLSAERLAEIEDAIKNKDEALLQESYPFLLSEFVRERNININFGLQQEAMALEFEDSMDEINHGLRNNQKVRNHEVETAEKEGADEILQALFT